MFGYVQNLIIVVLEILCCKIFFESFGQKRDLENSGRSISIFIALTLFVYIAAVFFHDYFIMRQLLIIIVTAGLMYWNFEISLLKSFIISALYQGLLLAVDYFTLFICFTVFHTMEEVGHSGSIIVVLSKIVLFLFVLLIRKYIGKGALLALADADWLIFLFFPIFTIGIIAAMLKTFGQLDNSIAINLFFIIACGLAGMNIAIFYLVYNILSREDQLRKEQIYRLKVKNQVDTYHAISENFSLQRKKPMNTKTRFCVLTH